MTARPKRPPPLAAPAAQSASPDMIPSGGPTPEFCAPPPPAPPPAPAAEPSPPPWGDAGHELRLVEAGAFEARLMPWLPVPWSFVARAVAGRMRLLVTSSETDYAAAHARRWNAVTAREWLALTHAAEQSRAAHAALRAFLARKQTERAWEITPEVALGAAITPELVTPLTVDAVLAAWGMRLVNVAATDPMAEGDYTDV